MKYLGVDLGGTRIKYGVLEQGNILEQGSCDTPLREGYEAVVQKIADAVRPLLRSYPDIALAGVGAPGLIDTNAGVVCYSNNFMWYEKPLQQDLERVLGLPVRIANDAHLAALGEALYGAGKQIQRVAMLTIGTGVGGGFVQNGRLETDRYASMAYIFGHEMVVLDGKQCNCGRRGCLEAYASAGAMTAKSRQLYRDDIEVSEVFRALKNGDSIAESIFAEFIEFLAEGTVNIANILRPQVIVIGGGVSDSAELFLPILNERLRSSVYGYRYAPVTAVRAQLGNAAGLMGAAGLVSEPL